MALQTSGTISVEDVWDEFILVQQTNTPNNGFGVTFGNIALFDRFKNFTRYETNASSSEFGLSDMYGASLRTSSITVSSRTDTAIAGLPGGSTGYGFGLGSSQNFYRPENGTYYNEPNYGGRQRPLNTITNYQMTGLHAIEYSTFYRVTLSVTSAIAANYASNAGFTTMEVRGNGYEGNGLGGTGSDGAAALNRTDATYFSEVKYHGRLSPSSPMQWTWDSSDKSTSSSVYGVFHRLKTAFNNSPRRAAIRFT